MPLIQSFTKPPPTPHNESAGFSLKFSGNINIKSQSPNGSVFRVKIGGNIEIKGKFVFSIPPPILSEIDENAFAVQIYTARLLDENNNEILITDATRNQPKGEIGERISLTIGRKDLSLINPDKLYTFQIGTWSNVQDAIDGVSPVWKTVCEDSRLSSRSFSIGRNGRLAADSLSFEIIESNKNKLNFYPPRNYILYDSLQINVELGDIERVYTSDGDYIRTTANAFPNLTLYKVLDFVKQRLGFARIETNLPNFPIVRANFPFERSYSDSIAAIAGNYEPTCSIQPGNVLRIQTKFAELPGDFEPREITISDFSQLNLQIPQSTHIDGVNITYLDSNAFADYYSDRLTQTREETGTFGSPNYTRTDINRTYRDWFENENPNVPLRTELIAEVHSTYDNTLNLIGRETNNHVYDAQGKRTNSARTIESQIPDLDNSGTLVLLTAREENQSVFYTTDAQNPRQQLQSKTITQISGLMAIDAENQYFDEDFKQDFLKAHKAGNLTVDMTSEFGLLQTITETLTPLGNNQFEVRTQTTDHLRGNTENSISEAKTGDASLNAISGKQKQFILWTDGVSTNTRTGGEIINLAAGFLPLTFAKTLAEIILHRRQNGFQEGSLTIPVYHESLQRGVFFRVFDRSGNSLGRFICESVNVVFRNLGTRQQTTISTVQISEV